MPTLFIVENDKGPEYDRTRERRRQQGWDEHATFMDQLVEEGTIVMGGPVGDIEGESTLLIMRAEDERALLAALEKDPWYETVLHLARVEPWTLWLGKYD